MARSSPAPESPLVAAGLCGDDRGGRRRIERPAGRAGFSLVELMGVIVVLGMMATMAFVSWQSVFPRTQLNSSVRELASTLYQTRSDAIARSVSFTLEYYFEETNDHPRGYRVVTPFRRGSIEGGLAESEEERMPLAWHLLPETVFFDRITVNGVEFTEGKVVIHFDANGSATDHTILLKQMPYENYYTLEVLALTGLVRFHDGEFQREYPIDSDFD